MSDLSSSLKQDSLKYKRRAQRINFEAMLRQYIPIVGAGLIFVLWFTTYFLEDKY